MASFEWTEIRIKAAELLAARNLAHQEIASSLEITRQTLWNWRRDPEFAARVEEITEENRRETRRIGLADKERRLASINDRWNRLRCVIEERADDPNHQKAPGGSTGLLARTLKQIGSGDSALTIEEFSLDAALLKALLDHERQAAVELGQWDEKGQGVKPEEITKLLGAIAAAINSEDDRRRVIHLMESMVSDAR